MGNSIKPHLETAQKTGACQLCKSGLNEFPNGLLKLSKVLRTLDLSDNGITQIPAAISTMEQLKHLSINQNKLASLPAVMGSLKKLESLSLSYNQLTILPASFGQLTNLRSLVLSGNRLTDIPELGNLKHLEVLDLSRNKIAGIPDHWHSLQVSELNLNQNQLSFISEKICECPRLKILRLEENCLPLTAFTPRILGESAISLLAVDGNLFEMKSLHNVDNYEKYMERYTATKKKLF